MGRAVDLFVTYRFLKLLTTPFEKQDAYKLISLIKMVIELEKKNLLNQQ